MLHVQDAVAVWQAVLGHEQPPTVIVGHSMGGAIATRAAGLQVWRMLFYSSALSLLSRITTS